MILYIVCHTNLYGGTSPSASLSLCSRGNGITPSHSHRAKDFWLSTPYVPDHRRQIDVMHWIELTLINASLTPIHPLTSLCALAYLFNIPFLRIAVARECGASLLQSRTHCSAIVSPWVFLLNLYLIYS